MLEVDLGVIEYFDGSKSEFIYEEGGIAQFEYTLRNVYEWEGKWRKPFLKGGLNGEELLDFCKGMSLVEIEDKWYTEELMEKLVKYIQDSNTATTFTTHDSSQNGNNNSKGKIFTSEEIYAMMFTNGVSLEFENRNLNRLLTMLRIIGNNNQPPKKMSKRDVLRQNAELNAKRKAAMKTRG